MNICRPDIEPVPAPVKRTQNRSSEELRMRELVVPRLRAQWPSARIIHELPLRYSTNRIDLAAVTETEIISVEIKSSKDVADRLEAQLRAFYPVSARLIVALAPKWNEKLPAKITKGNNYTSYSTQRTECQDIIYRIGTGVETWTVDADAGSVVVTSESYRTVRPWAAQMLDMLHVAELIEIAARHRICHAKRPNHFDLVGACNEMLTGREVIASVCRALRARPAFAAGTDAPIEVAA